MLTYCSISRAAATIMELQNNFEDLENTQDEYFIKKCSIISEDISTGRLTVLKLIEQLGSLLTNQSPSKREIGIALLSEVVGNLPSALLTSQQLQVIGQFYAARFTDHHQVLPCTLKGILTIIEFDNFPGESVPALLNPLFRNVACQQQQQTDRRTIYRIFQVLTDRFPDELLSMKLEFVYGVLTAIEGERDPRNLLFLFKWLKIFLGLVKLQHLAEDMFDVMACYFPVDFRAPPSEKSITREALAGALCPCLCAVPEFAEHCIPLALEKLDSSLEIAKIDSLQLLKEGCITFNRSIYLEKAPEIFSQLQKEFFNTNNTLEIKTRCLATLSDVVHKISHDEDDHYKDVLKNLIDSLKGNLLPDSKLFRNTTEILIHVAASSKNSSTLIAEEIVPLLTNILLITSNADHKAALLAALVEFTKCFVKYHASLDCTTVPELPKVLLLCLEALSSNDNGRKVGFNSLAALAEYLPQGLRLQLYGELRKSIVVVKESELRNSLLGCLTALATLHVEEVKEHVFGEIGTEPELVGQFLNAQCVLVSLGGFRDYIVDNFLKCIKDSALSGPALTNLRLLLRQKINDKDLSKTFLEKGALETLLDSGDSLSTVDLGYVSEVLKLLIGPQDSTTQRMIVERHLESVYARTLSNYASLVVLDGVVAALLRDIQVDYKILEVSFDVAVRDLGGVGDVALQLLANLVNKRADGDTFNNYLGILKDKCLAAKKAFQNDSNSIVTISWIAKALLMRIHPQSLAWLNCLLEMLEGCDEVADGLRIIMNDSYEALSSTCHCNISLLYRQKTFVHVSKNLLEIFDANKTVHSKAVGYLLEFAPLQVVLLQFKQISRLIILSLERSKDPHVLTILLATVRNVLSNKSAMIEEQLEDFLTRILQLTSFEDSMKVRIEALQCLVQFTLLFPVYKLLPFKIVVCQQLGKCVDDKKRLVRREAMEARSLWFLLDAPE